MTIRIARTVPESRTFLPPVTLMNRVGDGTVRLSSGLDLPTVSRCVGEWLAEWSSKAPNRTFLAERRWADEPWRMVSYRHAQSAVWRLAAYLMKQGLSEARPIAILSENSIDHALLALAAMQVGIPVATISPSYSLTVKGRDQLEKMIALLEPGLIYAADMARYRDALQAIAPYHRGRILVSDDMPDSAMATDRFDEAKMTVADNRVVEAFRRVGPDTIARLLFTSGSTGTPKAVINTQRMLCSNQAAKGCIWPFLEAAPPVLLDWLPWSHTFGANHNFNLVLRNGGTLFIDSGKPAAEAFDTTASNIVDVRPTVYLTVPRNLEMLAAEMRTDQRLCESFFSRLQVIMYAGASLSSDVWAEIESHSVRTVGRVVPIVSAWGATETAPLATDTHFKSFAGNLGVPIPGTEVKLVPIGDKLEIRVRGPQVTPGYWRRPDLSADAFDEEGYYRSGDAARLIDENQPEKGIVFEGRIGEDFKLSSGTWVNVAEVRLRALSALRPLAQDVVVAGHDRDAIGLLVVPDLAACRELTGMSEDSSVRSMLDHPAVLTRVAEALTYMKHLGGGTSRYANRARLLEHQPNPSDGEITDKGYINQRRLLERRREEVDLLFGRDRSAFVQV